MALKGDGVDDKLVNTLSFTTINWTLFFFARLVSAQSGTYKTMASGKGPGFGFGFAWDHADATFRQAIYGADETYKKAKLTSTLSLNTWYAFGGMYDGTNLTAWLNGTQEASVAAAFGSRTWTAIHGLAEYDGASNFDGAIARLAVWDADLSTGEMVALSKGAWPSVVRTANLRTHIECVRSVVHNYGGGVVSIVSAPSVFAHPPTLHGPKRRLLYKPTIPRIYMPPGIGMGGGMRG